MQQENLSFKALAAKIGLKGKQRIILAQTVGYPK